MEQTNPNSIPVDTWKIRPVRAEDYRAVRMLLPEAVYFGAGSIVWVASPENSSQVVAAAALSPRLLGGPFAGARVALHVIPPWRTRGIATALIQTVARLAHAYGAKALFAHTPVESASDAERAWRTLGFTHVNPMQVTQVDMQRAYEYLRPLYEQVTAHGWIPPEAQIVALRQVNPGDIAILHAKYLGGTVRDLLLRLSGQTLEPIHPTLSPALLYHGEVKAFTLVRMVEQTCHVDATVVDPTLRNGWANLWLKFQGISWALAAGARTMVFHTFDRHTDTRKLGRQMGGVTRYLVEPYKLLGAD